MTGSCNKVLVVHLTVLGCVHGKRSHRVKPASFLVRVDYTLIACPGTNRDPMVTQKGDTWGNLEVESHASPKGRLRTESGQLVILLEFCCGEIWYEKDVLCCGLQFCLHLLLKCCTRVTVSRNRAAEERAALTTDWMVSQVSLDSVALLVKKTQIQMQILFSGRATVGCVVI